ncbi:MAG: hypothetical protein KDK70_08455 [Myxococcales bacterium]|nr:hypothetical protein [Myxococcales bacterium]
MPLYVLAIGLTILANVGYHLCQKAIRPDVGPAASLVVTYAVALLLTLALWPWLGGGEGLGPALRRLGPASYGLGACVVLLELGFLLAYRAGWDIGVAALYSNAAVALVLLPIGLWAFAEGIDARKALGLALAFAGLVLLSRSPGSAPGKPVHRIGSPSP